MKQQKIYAEILDDGTLQQFNEAMSQPEVVKGSLMADAHLGYSLPIGGVVACKDHIFPAYVGYDIGCGVCAYQLCIHKDSVKDKGEDIFNSIYRVVPTGMGNVRKEAQEWDYNKISRTEELDSLMKERGLRQLGTLGGGNHFIEIGYDESDMLWVIVHSGSRGVGHKTATRHMKIASNSDRAKEGHYGLHVDSQDGENYIKDMNFCLEFALENRKQIARSVAKQIHHYAKTGIVFDETLNGLINRNHNHADLAHGYWIHRKGATHAEKGMLGVIPGNMRDGSFVVEGKGCEESLWSSSHGAGRVYGRKEAKRKINMEDFEETMSGITAKVEEGTKDEAPFAYKNIFEVMDAQKDLVKVLHHIKPLINIKA